VAVEVVRDLPGALIALECAEPGLGVVVSDRIASHSGDPSSSFLRPLMRSYRLRFDLCRSAFGGDAEAIARLIADGADVNTRGRGPSSSQGLTWPPEGIVEGPFRRECTPLGLAAAQGHTVAVELLLQHGAEVDAPQRWWGSQWTPLQLACASGHSTTAAALVAGGAQLGDDASDLVYGAAVAGHAALVETLLGCGVDIDGRSPDGRTPLDAAASAGNAAAVALLLSKGAKAMPRSVGATTPLHSAAWSGSVEVVSALLDHDADLGATDAQGDTPLHVAAGRGKAEVVRVLLDRGADLGATNAQGDTPLHVAAGHGQAEVVRVLLDRGADPRARNAASKTPLTLARKSRHQTVVRLLEKAR
jgi:ankyrin repeat protein